MSAIVEAIKNFLLSIFQLEELVVVFISVIPIVESRGAVPIAISYGLHPLWAWFYSFIACLFTVTILLVAFIPLLNLLSKTKLFKKVGTVLYEKFEEKSQSLSSSNSDNSKKSGFKVALGLFMFAAIPLPLTGVWTASAIAAMLKVNFKTAAASIITGNLVASGLMTLICVFFSQYLDIIMLIIAVAAIVIAAGIIFKIITSKPKDKTAGILKKQAVR